MRIHYLQHVAFEGPGIIADYASLKGHHLAGTLLFDGGTLPALNDFDLLVILGGPMNIYEEGKYSWLAQEKQLIRAAINGGKTVLGICLGAQLLADVLGACVTPGAFREIGWFPIVLTDAGRETEFSGFFPDNLPVFHWHGDTFTIPQGAIHLAKSEGCLNQAFVYDDRVLALQFHLESTPESIRSLIENCADEIAEGKYIRGAEEMLSSPMGYFCGINEALFSTLDHLILQSRI